MRVITVEEHFSSGEVSKECRKHAGGAPHMPAPDEKLSEFYQSFQKKLAEELEEVGENRLRFMDGRGIDVQVLSYNNTIPQTLPPDASVGIHRLANDVLAQSIAKYPSRFAGFAILPLADPNAAAKELERAVQKLGFHGAVVNGAFQRRFLESPEFFPIFEAAVALDVPIYFHPSFIPQDISDYYFKSDCWSTTVTGKFAATGFGWHMDIGIHVIRMILSGIFDRLPGLKLISGHWGEFAPCFLERMDAIMIPELTGLERPVSEYYKEHVYLTPSGILSQNQLEFAVKVMGADHILHSMDFPYIKESDALGFVTSSNLSNPEKEKFAHGNAEMLLKLCN